MHLGNTYSKIRTVTFKVAQITLCEVIYCIKILFSIWRRLSQHLSCFCHGFHSKPKQTRYFGTWFSRHGDVGL